MNQWEQAHVIERFRNTDSTLLDIATGKPWSLFVHFMVPSLGRSRNARWRPECCRASVTAARQSIAAWHTHPDAGSFDAAADRNFFVGRLPLGVEKVKGVWLMWGLAHGLSTTGALRRSRLPRGPGEFAALPRWGAFYFCQSQENQEAKRKSEKSRESARKQESAVLSYNLNQSRLISPHCPVENSGEIGSNHPRSPKSRS